jgi:hypothetical protein
MRRIRAKNREQREVDVLRAQPLNAGAAEWARETAGYWMEMDLREMCHRGSFEPDDEPPHQPTRERK